MNDCSVVRRYTCRTCDKYSHWSYLPGLIKENSERFVGVVTLLDNGQGSTQVFLAP